MEQTEKQNIFVYINIRNTKVVTRTEREYSRLSIKMEYTYSEQ
jgi:hypothetical protein